MKTAAASGPPALTGYAKTLDEGEKLYASRELDKSREKFLQALRETAEKPAHAKAYYGLARIALLQNDPETAERLFQKTLELEPEPQDKAWVYVYLGRLSDLAGEREAAAKHYESALAVKARLKKRAKPPGRDRRARLERLKPNRGRNRRGTRRDFMKRVMITGILALAAVSGLLAQKVKARARPKRCRRFSKPPQRTTGSSRRRTFSSNTPTPNLNP